jgi:peptidyl-prolyl cis-trans isomerase C
LAKVLSLTLIAFALVSGAGCKKAPAPPTTTATPPAGSPAAAATAPATPAAGPLTPPQPPPAPATPPAPVPATLPNVLAHVNDENVTKADFDRLLRNIELQNKAPVPAERRNEIYRGVLDELVTYTALKQEAKARNFTVSDAEVEEQINVMRQQAGGDAPFKKALASRKMTLERLRSDARVQIAIAKMMTAQAANATAATDADAREFYDKNPDQFKRPEMVRASHILLVVDPKADAATKNQARTAIDAILKRARSGEDFAALAQQNSQHQTAPQGGDLGYFTRETMTSTFAGNADPVFGLKAGEISGVVTTNTGVHIIKITDRKTAGTVPLEEVSPKLKEFLTEQKKRQQAQAFVEQIKQKAKIEVLI